MTVFTRLLELMMRRLPSDRAGSMAPNLSWYEVSRLFDSLSSVTATGAARNTMIVGAAFVIVLLLVGRFDAAWHAGLIEGRAYRVYGGWFSFGEALRIGFDLAFYAIVGLLIAPLLRTDAPLRWAAALGLACALVHRLVLASDLPTADMELTTRLWRYARVLAAPLGAAFGALVARAVRTRPIERPVA